MFVFGHIGVGRAIIGSRGRALPFVPLAIGMLLPDVIDKPLYYLRVSPFISCTRTFGHTGLLVLLLFLCAWIASRRSPRPSGRGIALAALAVGAATHDLLDMAVDFATSGGTSSTLIALAWPVLDTHFFVYPFKTVFDQIRGIWKTPVMICEVIGLLCLSWEFRRRQ